MTATLTSAVAALLLIGVPGLIGYAVLGGIMRFLGLRSWKHAACFYAAQFALVAAPAAMFARSVGQMLFDGSLDGPAGFGAGALAGVAMFSAIGLEIGATISMVLVLLRTRRGNLPKITV